MCIRDSSAAWEKNFKLSYREQPLREVVADLAKKTGVNMRIDESHLAEEGVSLWRPVTCDLPPLPMYAALDRLAQCPALKPFELAWCFRDDCLVLTTALDANTEQE